MSWIKADNPQEQKHFNYLEELRKDGDTNMYGAAPYLRARFPEDFPPKRGFHDKPCGAVLKKWMDLHNKPDRVLDVMPKVEG